MEIRVLGPLAVCCGSAPATPTAPKPRSVLALLLLQANQTVPVPDLIRELWGEGPPASALTTLQTYVLQLRKRFAKAMAVPTSVVAERVLVTVPGGYEFRDASDDFDLPSYQRLATDGRRQAAAGNDGEAANLLLRAQALWRGPALSDVPPGPVVEPQIRRLHEFHLATVEQSIETRLRLGQHQEVLSELAGMTAQYPLHENLHALFMVALHRSGRRQEALRTFQHLRSTMIDDLGLEPSKRLRLLQQAVLADDPQLECVPPDDSLEPLLDRLGTR